MKVVRRKKLAAAPKTTVGSPKVATIATKAATIVAPKTVAAAALKADAMMKASATLVASATALKAAAAARQKGAPGTTKAATLKVKSEVKRCTDMELSLVKDVKESKKFSLASSFVLASTQKVAAPSSPAPRSNDDDRVELISMLGGREYVVVLFFIFVE
jgi:hypothetical protein